MSKAMKVTFSTISLLIALLWVPNVDAEPLTIVGTGDGTHVLRALANNYITANPEQVIHVPDSVGSSGGIKLVGKRKNILGRVAREIKENEKKYGLKYMPYARIPVVFYVNNSVDVNHLTIRQILNIYRGDAQDWSEFGGSPGKIRVIRRERGDSSSELLNKKIASFENIRFTEFIKVATSEKRSVELVSLVPGAIGFGPFPDSRGPEVKVLSLEGKYPSDEGYILELVLAMIFHDENNTGLVNKFINYITSDNGKAVIRSGKALPY
ncbi:MAG: substrate-binding domain-containing protein [Sneathiella sp.]|nr:substrate-binding domain-containing protein [Sneathiella sp.]